MLRTIIQYLPLSIVFLFIQCKQPLEEAGSIDRKSLVRRHNIVIQQFDTLNSLTVGNGEFAFTVDATGLQTFPGYYEKGVCLGTQSQWGWHSFPNTERYGYDETLKEYDFYGRKISYDVQWRTPERKRRAMDYFRRNPHRLHLGILGLNIRLQDGSPASINDIRDIRQELDMWTGEIKSTFSVDGDPVEVITLCHPEKDMIAVRLSSPMIEKGLLNIDVRFPYPDGEHVADGIDWSHPEKHSSRPITGMQGSARVIREMDNTRYYVSMNWKGDAVFSEQEAHRFMLVPGKDKDTFSFTCLFSQEQVGGGIPGFDASRVSSQGAWKDFWESGGAVDFSGSTDPRAGELERRVILSQYLTRIQCAGSLPPQETGLTFNSWYGKFHLEMHWWHGVHFALWNRIELLEKSLDYYDDIRESARIIAQRQGFEGLRWPKMTGPGGIDSPSSIGSFLIWQQPHFIYFAELCFRHHQDKETLEKYADLVFETADFMASYAHYDAENDRYVLGPLLIPAQECYNPLETVNPAFELAYWHWGLSTAQAWRERMEMTRKPEWDRVLNKLSGLSVKDSLYLFAENAAESYTERYTHDHPIVLGAYGMLPESPLVDKKIMRNTFDKVWDEWQWKRTWGWDFPMTAMTAARLGMPEKAIDALFMDIPTNTYLVNGHNYQDERLRIYLPGNGGLLTAVAMMTAGFNETDTITPGFPKNGTWNVRWEGLSTMP